MGRLDFKNGRFGTDYETDQIEGALRGWQGEFGDALLYYRFWQEQSQTHDIFDEATEAGRIYHPPQRVPVLHVTHIEGGQEQREQGFYYNDDLYVKGFFEDFRDNLGFTDLDIVHQHYMRDRVVYDYKVFKVLRLSITGQIQERDIMVSMEATQVKPDELINDPQFKKYLDPDYGAR